MDPLKDDWHVTGGIPKSVAIHGRCATGGNPASVTRQIAVDNDGRVLFSGGGGGGSEVTVVNEPGNPVLTDETLYSSIDIDMVTIPYVDGITGEQTLPDGICRGFLLMAARTNTSSVWVGSATDRCYIELVPGARKDYALKNPSHLYILNTDKTPLPDGPQDQILVIERYY